MKTAVHKTIAGALAFLNETALEWHSEGWKGPFFLRGQRDQWPLLPSLYRKPPAPAIAWSLSPNAVEQSLFAEFKRRAPPYLSQLPSTDMEWLSLMQHHGLKTRLLDWSENFLAAIFFALRRAEEGKEPIVYMLNPEALNRVTTGRPNLILQENPKLLDYSHLGSSPRYPAALFLPYTHPRIAAQHGAFTIHGKDIHPLSSLDRDDVLASVTFDSDASYECYREMKRMGITETMFFPDLDHLSKEISNRHVY